MNFSACFWKKLGTGSFLGLVSSSEADLPLGASRDDCKTAFNLSNSMSSVSSRKKSISSINAAIVASSPKSVAMLSKTSPDVARDSSGKSTLFLSSAAKLTRFLLSGSSSERTPSLTNLFNDLSIEAA